MKKNILLVAPRYMDLYKDIVREMKEQNYDVDFVPEQVFKDDPDNIRGYVRFSKLLTNKKNFNKKLELFWKERLNNVCTKCYDYVFVLDGQSISPIFFKELRKRNSAVKFINYLFDTTTGVYHFEKNFQYFDKVYSFDIRESQKYKIGFLPIYWLECECENAPKFDLFGLGAVKDDRFVLFSRLEKIAKARNLTYYLKLFDFVKAKNMFMYKLRYAVYKFLGVRGTISPKALLSSYITRVSLPPEEFRRYIAGAKVVVDTSAVHQDGLTARFMWSIGLGKKIITTNRNVRQYSFFDSRQILVLDEQVTNNQIEEFVTSKYTLCDVQRKTLESYKIDSWLQTLLA